MFFFENFLFLAIFDKKWLSPRKNFQRENFFEINFFGLKYVLKHSESIPKKKFSKIFFENFHFVTPFVKIWLSPRKNNFKGNFFRNQLFRFKTRFEKKNQNRNFTKNTF